MDKKRIEVFRDFVMHLAQLSKCRDKGVAAIITDRDGSQVYSVGINGGPKHGVNCLCELGGKYTCVHAEANALAKCTVADAQKVFFCSLSPCVTCAALIVNSGASAVYYVEQYKDDAGLRILRDAGIIVKCIDKDVIAYEEALDRLRLGLPVHINTCDAGQLKLRAKLQAYAREHHVGLYCTCLRSDYGGPIDIEVKLVKFDGRDNNQNIR